MKAAAPPSTLGPTPGHRLRRGAATATQDDSLGSNTRLRWTFRPEGALFVIYNHGVRRFGDRFAREAQGLLVKLQYMFRR